MSSLDVHEAENVGPVRGRRRWLLVALGVCGALALSLFVLARIVGLASWWIPSEEMEPSVSQGDRLLTWSWGEVARGDIVVFDKPPDFLGSTEHLIKRVVALPGEAVSFEGGLVHVDGQPLDEPYLAPGSSETVGESVMVPAGHIYVLGDNRTASADSRLFGPVSLDLVDSNKHRIWRRG
jgi:signal peptidase I